MSVTVAFNWPIEFHANGELQAFGRLTDEQIRQVIRLIIELGGKEV